MRPEAVIFDLDGTLTDNMPLHRKSFDRFLAARGLPPLSEQLRHRLDGKRNRDIFPVLLGRELGEEELRAFGEEKESLYRELSRGHLRPLDGLLGLLDFLQAEGLPVALATSAPAPNIPHTLGELGLAARFPVVVRSDEVPRGKPWPDVFLEAARRLGRATRRCLAFEDSPAGVEAAAAAGMNVVAITTTFPPRVFEKQGRASGAFPEFRSWWRAQGRRLFQSGAPEPTGKPDRGPDPEGPHPRGATTSEG